MTDYNDVPQVTTLHAEQERVLSAIDMIDAGGTLSTFVITPGPPPEGQPGMMVMPAQVSTTGTPVSAAFLTECRKWLITRGRAINRELANLGVTNPRPNPSVDEDDASDV